MNNPYETGWRGYEDLTGARNNDLKIACPYNDTFPINLTLQHIEDFIEKFYILPISHINRYEYNDKYFAIIITLNKSGEWGTTRQETIVIPKDSWLVINYMSESLDILTDEEFKNKYVNPEMTISR